MVFCFIFALSIVTECSAVGSALRSGRRGRAFESPHSDTTKESCMQLSFVIVYIPFKNMWRLGFYLPSLSIKNHLPSSLTQICCLASILRGSVCIFNLCSCITAVGFYGFILLIFAGLVY